MVRGIEPLGRRRRRRRTQSEGEQPERTPMDIASFLSKVWLVIQIAFVGIAILVLWSIGSCAVNWGRNAVRESAVKAKQLAGDFEQSFIEPQIQRQIDQEEEQKRQVAAQEEQEKLWALHLGIRRWLSLAYSAYPSNEWENLNLELRQISDTEKSLVFPVIPYKGTHLPPIDLALAPFGTVLLLKDEEAFIGGIDGRNLWVMYQGSKRHTRSRGGVSIANDAFDTPRLLLKSRFPDQHQFLPSTCTLTVQYPDQSTLQMDGNTRLALEKVFCGTDLGKSVKVMDLPTVIDDVPVHWDLVVRCYPAWKSDPGTNTGRWMYSPVLNEAYLSHFSPSLSIKQTEDPGESEIWIDDEGLLSSGSFMTSSEEMIARVHGWRADKGKPDLGWSGGNQLHILVKGPPNQFKEEGSIEVTVRVVLRVRTWTRG